jgi:hypothetical protein
MDSDGTVVVSLVKLVVGLIEETVSESSAVPASSNHTVKGNSELRMDVEEEK